MNNYSSIFVWAPLLGWFIAHVIKFLLVLVASRGKNKDLRVFFRAGGMPSSHTAVMVATATVIGAREGLDSAIFGLSVAIAAIVIYDALNVRRSVGQQGDVLRKVVAHTKIDDHFFTAYGHTLPEVAGGFLVGLAVAYSLLQIL